MSSVTWPDRLIPTSFKLALSINQRSHSAPYGGSEQVVDLLNDRWTISMTLPENTQAAAAITESFINAMRGMTNTVDLWHFKRPVIAGTLSGATAQAASQGASQIILNASTGQTLKAGDMIGVGGLLLQVASDCVSVGSAITIPLVNRLRKTVAAGSAVITNKPTASFRLINKVAPQYTLGYSESVSLEFVEKVT